MCSKREILIDIWHWRSSCHARRLMLNLLIPMDPPKKAVGTLLHKVKKPRSAVNIRDEAPVTNAIL